jgi:lysophospholipase L1-like esterase
VSQSIPDKHYQSTSLATQATVRTQQARMLFLLALLLPCLTACTLPFSSTKPATNSRLVLQQAPAARQIYVAIGASDTYGIGSDDPDEQNWPADLTRLLGHNTRMINLGVPSIDAHQALNVELPVALDAHPDLVTIWLAVNDLADQVPVNSYAQDLNTLLSRLHSELPHARIAVANVPDLSYLPRFANVNHQSLEQQIQAYNAVIATIVARYQDTLVDLYHLANQLASHPEYISSDGFHPNTLGYEIVAQVFYQVLQKNSP